MESESPQLDRIERWMLAAVTHPNGAAEGLRTPEALSLLPEAARDLENVVLPSKNMSSEERLQVYANMYYWRLIDILFEEHKTTHHILGADLFCDLARDYLHRHPSRSKNLALLGSSFPAYLAEEAWDVPHRDFVVEVARLERATEEVFDALRSPSIDKEELAAIPPESWADAKLEFIPATRLLSFKYPVNAYVQAVKDGEEPEVPEPAPSWVLLYRHDWRVWRSDLTRPQAILLESLRRGDSLGEALAHTASQPGIDGDALAADVGGWFQKWTGLDLIRSILV
ncbi:MAG TPA: DUF2063 domain-containing protein [Planctomycetes bacterium]|nr:DUF2063 domain-containing protein [Planctomycetota bacterium]